MTDKPGDQNALEDLIVGHFDGSLSEDQEKELAVELAESTSAKQLFLSYMRMEGRLHSLVRDGFFRGPDAAAQDNVHSCAEIAPAAQVNDRRFAFTRSRRWATSSSLAVCVVLLLILGWGLWPAAVSASSVLRQAQRAAADMVDRAYRVTISGGNVQWEAATQELMIHIRGGRRYVFQSIDGSYAMGSDGIDFWLTQQGGPVWVMNDYRTFRPESGRRIPNRGLLELADSRDEVFMMPMSSMLSRIEGSYDAELVESFDPAENHVRATLRSQTGNRAQTIEFWADADSGVVLRAELRWENGRLTRFELVDSPTLSDQWYHYSQHAPDRQVIRLETTK
jgi:outer membrane lipoprotein-sorting protein